MIFFLSCTGNTHWAATTISRTIGEPIVDIAEAMLSGEKKLKYHLEKDERIGFCFPVHGWRPPMIVREFISRLSLSATDDNYCWALCTAGDDIGESMEILNKDLRHIGLQTDSEFSLIMPESYVGLPFMDVDKPAKEWNKREKAATYLRLYANTIDKREKDLHLTYKGHWPKTNSRLLGSFFKNFLISDKPFRVDTDKCIQCGLCAEVCPVDNIISGKDKTTEWLHNGNCLSCFACYHHCPTKAIAYGSRTKKKGQYYYGKNNKKTS